MTEARKIEDTKIILTENEDGTVEIENAEEVLEMLLDDTDSVTMSLEEFMAKY